MDIQQHTSKNVNKVKTKQIVEKVLKEYGKLLFKFSKGKCISEIDCDKHIEIDKAQWTIEDFLTNMDLIFNALTTKQKLIILERYVKNEGNNLDCDVLDLTYLSERTYYREKLNAILFISDLLNITIYNE